MTRSLVIVPLALLFGCATPMLVSTTPAGAEITVDGKAVGKSPATVQVDSGGAAVSVKAKANGKEVTKSVPKDQTNWSPVAAGAGVGVGTCCAASAGASVITVLVPFASLVALPITCLGCAALVGAPVGAYFLWGSKPADQVSVELGPPGAPAGASGAPDAPGAPVAPPAPAVTLPDAPPPAPLEAVPY